MSVFDFEKPPMGKYDDDKLRRLRLRLVNALAAHPDTVHGLAERLHLDLSDEQSVRGMIGAMNVRRIVERVPEDGSRWRLTRNWRQQAGW